MNRRMDSYTDRSENEDQLDGPYSKTFSRLEQVEQLCRNKTVRPTFVLILMSGGSVLFTVKAFFLILCTSFSHFTVFKT